MIKKEGTLLYSAVIDGLKLVNLKQLYKATPNTKVSQHWGSRMVLIKKVMFILELVTVEKKI